jgi:hypothetical protein
MALTTGAENCLNKSHAVQFIKTDDCRCVVLLSIIYDRTASPLLSHAAQIKIIQKLKCVRHVCQIS